MDCLYNFFYAFFFLSTREFHVGTNMLSCCVFGCVPCMYDNINKPNHMHVEKNDFKKSPLGMFFVARQYILLGLMFRPGIYPVTNESDEGTW